MAAGMGSRFGGLKQIAPIGKNGEILLDYSVYDAVKAGFNKVVFVIKHAIEQDFKAVTAKHIEKMVKTEYVFQETDELPEGFTCPADRTKARQQMGLPEEGRIVLFVSQKVTNERKGAAYFIEAINRLADSNPQFKSNTTVAILGASADEIAEQLHIPSYPLGYISDAQQIANVYNAADVYVLPSLEDNLPNTIMEAMACGVPSVGFRVGGIPEMIDHKHNGYVANFKDAADLAEGIRWTLFEADSNELAANCLHKVAHNYSQQSVAMRYIEVYNELIALKRYII